MFETIWKVHRARRKLLERSETLRHAAEIATDDAKRIDLEREAHELETQASVLRHSGLG